MFSWGSKNSRRSTPGGEEYYGEGEFSVDCVWGWDDVGVEGERCHEDPEES